MYEVFITAAFLYSIFIVGQFIQEFYQTYFHKRKRPRISNRSVKTLIVIGSGGHTSEILKIVKHMNHSRYSPRVYVMASSDSWSENRIKDVERNSEDYKLVKIPRSRNVHQSYITSVVTTLYSILYSLPVLFYHNPDLILCNGPGTCIPICLVAFFMRVIRYSNNVIIFIESICRVKTLSLSGQIMRFFADEMLVQWPELQKKYSETKYIGRL